ncbi:IS481 family transposase [Spirochaetia bacterium]|nr:IS481 family transposase [Spirochaetia bacterium]
MTTNTTIAEKAARRKLSLLELANELDNVSKACKIMGYSREQFYEIRRNYQSFGAEGLLDKVRGPKNPHPNRVSEELEKSILDYCLEYPTQGSLRVSQQLILRGIHVGVGAVRGVWQRHNILSKHQRLLRLEQHHKDTHIELTEAHIQLLEKFDPEFRERHIQADFSGQLVAIDTFMVGNLKGIGKIYLQTVVDCHSRFAWGHLYTSKVPVTAVHVLNDKVLPFFEEQNCPVSTVLSDNGREYCGRPEQHPFELFLQLENIEHRTTQVRRPQSNGIVERLHRTLLDEHFRIQGRVKFYESIEEMQVDLDNYLHTYNYDRAHQGRNMNGRTPYQAFVEGIPTTSLKEDQAV